MNIAIDLDGTIDKHLAMWEVVCKTMSLLGNHVYLVTSRSECDRNVANNYAASVGISRISVICTNGTAKKWFCEQRGLRIDVWIDDDPASIINGK